MGRHELTDEQWEAVRQHLPAPKNQGRPLSDRRQMLDGILWILRTGAPWRDLPDRFGPWKTVYHYFNKWRENGTIDEIMEALQVHLDRQGQIDWDLWCIDGSSIRATRSAAGGGEKGGQKSRETTPLEHRGEGSEASST